MKPRSKIRRHKNLGPFHDLLLRACPPDPETGIKSIVRLAGLLDMTPWGVFKWVKNDHIPPAQAVRIVALHDEWAAEQNRVKPEERVTLHDFDAYVYN